MVNRRAFAWLAGGALVVAACANVLGIEDLSNAVPPPADAGPDTFRDPCTSAPGPLKPQAADGPNVIAKQFALSTIDFGTLASRPGLNLDVICTADREGGSCVSPATNSAASNDGPGGIDNALVGVLGNNVVAVGSVGAAVVKALKDGIWSLLLRLEDWSGADDDPQVTVRLATGTGLVADAGVPKWDVDGLSVDGGLAGGPTSREAWVTRRVVRAAFDDLTFIARSDSMGTFKIELADAYVVGTLDAQGNELDGVLTGRWRLDRLMGELARLKVVNVCVGTVTRPGICDGRDIMARAKDDKKGFECDALSFAFSFGAVSASFADPPVDAGPLSPQICLGVFSASCN